MKPANTEEIPLYVDVKKDIPVIISSALAGLALVTAGISLSVHASQRNQPAKCYHASIYEDGERLVDSLLTKIKANEEIPDYTQDELYGVYRAALGIESAMSSYYGRDFYQKGDTFTYIIDKKQVLPGDSPIC